MIKLFKQITVMIDNLDSATTFTVKIFVASLTVLLSCAAVSHLTTSLYGIMYFVVFLAIFSTFISFIVLLFLLAKRYLCKN